MPRGIRREAPAADWSTDAGPPLDVPEPAPEPAPAPAQRPAPEERTVRQTLDLPASVHDRLHAEVRSYARELGFHPRDLNVQVVLRALVRRMLDADHAAADGLWQQTFHQAREDAETSKRGRRNVGT